MNSPLQSFLEEKVWRALQRVIDPELHVNIVDLGLIYGVHLDNGNVSIQMTLTTPGCPLGEFIVNAVKSSVEDIPNVEHVEVLLTWDPPWNPAMIADDLPI